MIRPGFTLIEMLLAAVLAALLMGGVLLMTAAIGRDRARIAQNQTAPRGNALVDQFRWDLSNAATLMPLGNGRALVLIGHGGIDPRTLTPSGRLARVIYEVRGRTGAEALFRRQEYLDDPARPEPWTELVAVGVIAFNVAAESGDAAPVREEKSAADDDATSPPPTRKTPRAYLIPSRARLRVQRTAGSLDEELWLR